MHSPFLCKFDHTFNLFFFSFLTDVLFLPQAFLYLKWNQVKYLYMLFIVSSHFVFSVVFSLYALLLYCSLCGATEEKNRSEDRWKIFTSSVGLLFSIKVEN